MEITTFTKGQHIRLRNNVRYKYTLLVNIHGGCISQHAQVEARALSFRPVFYPGVVFIRMLYLAYSIRVNSTGVIFYRYKVL